MNQGIFGSQERTQLPAAVVGRAYAEYTARTTLSAVIPPDGTIPQNTEGTQILSVSYAPKSAANRLRARFQCSGSSSLGCIATAAIFQGSNVNAVGASAVHFVVGDYFSTLTAEVEFAAGSTSTTAQTIAVRVGPNANDFLLNGNLGGSARATLVVEEIVP